MMKNTLKTMLGTFVMFSACGVASATPIFHTVFDEPDLGSITGLNTDTPTGQAGSGTISLNAINQTLDLTANAANLWTGREGAPIAWVSSPSVASGETWYVEASITHADSPEGGNVNAAGFDQAGITFFSGTPGANPGSENGGTHQSLFTGISDWNQWHHRVQGFADNNPNASVAATRGDDTFGYRVEITGNGANNLYNFFYREDDLDPWTPFGPANLAQDFNNDAVGLFMKSSDANTTAATAFNSFTVGVVIPEPSSAALLVLGGLALFVRRRA